MNDIDNDKAAEQALTPIPASQIRSYQGEIEFAQLMAKAKILPSHLHGNPGNCLAVITMAQSWNMNPIMVGLKTSVIPKKGGGETLMFEGQLVNAAITNSGKLQGRLRFNMSGNDKDTICEVVGLLKGETEARTVTVGMPRTQNSPLWTGNQGDKEQQLSYLAARMWCRRHAPEILLGVYTPEDPWEEREPDAVTERRAAVQSRVAALENNPSPVMPAGRDDFIDVVTGPANVPGGVMSLKPGTVPGEITTGTRLPEDAPHIAIDMGRPGGDMTATTIFRDGKVLSIETEEPDPLDEAIPDFGSVKCGTCGGRGLLENSDGDKEPCPDCKGK